MSIYFWQQCLSPAWGTWKDGKTVDEMSRGEMKLPPGLCAERGQVGRCPSSLGSAVLKTDLWVKIGEL